MKIAAKYLQVSVLRAMKLPEDLIDKAFTAAVAQNQARDNRIEIEKKRNA